MDSKQNASPQSGSERPETVEPSKSDMARLSWRVIPFSVLLCLTQVGISVYAENVYRTFITSSMISVMAFVMLIAFVLLLNPLLRCTRWIQTFSKAELVCVYSALIVTAGMSTFGMANHLVPIVHAPWNPEWNTAQRGWDEALTHPDSPVLNPQLFLQDADAIELFRQGVPQIDSGEERTFAEWGPYLSEIFEAIPWGHWAGPLCWWLIFFAAFFGLFYALSYVVVGYWSDREKLVFPLARLAESFMPATDEGKKSVIPHIFTRPAFFAAFAVVAFVLSWNAAVQGGWIYEAFRIPMGMPWFSFGNLVDGTFLGPLGNRPDGAPAATLGLTFGFLAIGIGFLLPVHVSFSSWFYFLIGQVMILLGVWLGFGEHAQDFAGSNNIRGSQGSGALFIFSLLSLWRCVGEYFRLIRGRALRDRLFLMLPVALMVFCQIILVAWLWFNQVSILWAAAYILFATLLSLGFMRIVAEAGIYYFQSALSWGGFTNTFGLGGLIGGENMARLVTANSMLFFDLKAFVAPSFLTAAKLQRDHVTKRRWIFHTNLFVCIGAVMVSAVVWTLVLAHMRGAQQMYGWFYSRMPQRVIDEASRMLEAGSGLAGVNASWFVIGAAFVLFSVWVRQRAFWFPHPIGYILLVNGLMTNLWFSFLIGWFCKAMVIKYGGKRTFDTLLPFFLGLIAAELLTAFVWVIVGFIFNFDSGLLPG